MIKVIDGKRYNTETAELVYDYDNGAVWGDFRYRSKTLYVTKAGAWFLHHVGGASSDMAKSLGNGSRSGSSDIEAINADDAYGFLEAHSNDSEALAAIEKYFPDRVVEA